MALLRQINLNGTNANDAIVPYEGQYLVKVCGRWRAGTFDRQWYGLNFTNYGSEGIELEAIDEVYEIVTQVGEDLPTIPAHYVENA